MVYEEAMEVKLAGKEDLKEILSLQKECYQEEAEIYKDYEIQPLTQTIESIFHGFEKEKFFKIEKDHQIIGSVRILIAGKTGKIGRLIVHKDYRNQGLGKKMMKYLEAVFPFLERFELFTGDKSERNLYLYKKLGYQEFKRQKVNNKPDLVFLEKFNMPANSKTTFIDSQI